MFETFFFYRYAFGADNSGTHFYHSHISTFLIDGQYGSLIIREPPELNPYFYNYDVDRPEHVMIISDWLHELTLERYPGRYRSNRGQVAENFLVNGRGDWTVRAISIPIIIVHLFLSNNLFIYCINYNWKLNIFFIIY